MGKQRIKPNYRRRVLRLPDLDHCRLAVLNSLGSPASRRIFGIVGSKDVLRRYQTIQSAKNDAIYAGVRKGNHQIVRPFLISASKAKQQLRTVNNALTGCVKGTLNGTHYYEEVADHVFRSRRLLNKLARAAKTIR
jgi:hypothetical protein